jgi:hypothetical protein
MAKESHSSSRAKSALGGHGSKSKSKGGKKPHSIHIKRGHSGGFIVTHHHAPADDGSQQEPEDNVVPDLAALHDHVDQAMGDQGPAPAPTPEPPPAASAGAGAPPVAPTPGM